MATYTTNLDLKKPAQSDKIRIADINNNMDTIDGAVGDIGERSIAAQIGDVEGALAIVAVGNTHAAISAGQYVYVKGHSTLDDGLYVANSNISANGTLSSSNLTADTAGGLNALNGKLNSLFVVVQELEDVTVGANAGAQIGTTVNVPSGYKILGCLAPSTTASSVACVSLVVNASNNTISGLARNFSGSSATVTISFNVLCVKI